MIDAVHFIHRILQELSWTRSEEDAEADLREDEGVDFDPLSYFFIVEIGDLKSEQSESILHLTTTVYADFTDDNPETEADGFIAVLEAADGSTHEKPINEGVAVFENIVVGPIKIYCMYGG